MRTCSVSLFVLVFIAGCTSAGMQSHKHTQPTKHYEESVLRVTDNGLFSVEMVIRNKELKIGANEADLIIHDGSDRDVVGADISVTPWMPEMGHGVLEKPLVTERGGGLYSVGNIVPIMREHLELKIDIRWKDNGAEIEDSVVFDFHDVQAPAGHEHGTAHTTAPSEMDLSSARMSDRGSFKVSYESDIEPLPINRIHAWTIKVETPDGRPVKNAQISIDGDMPEHGHGLPTQPEVTQETGDGEYLVEGMKFSMPGLWTMEIFIRTPDREESVIFNLLLKE